MSKTCFVMMPFKPLFQSHYDNIFRPAIVNVGLKPIKVDEVYTPTQISDDIFELIQDASIILADVTGKNPNVNYELGIAHALGKKTVIVTQSSDDVPFDYQHLRYILYDTKSAGWDSTLLKKIESSISSVSIMNSPTTNLAGKELESLFNFLENTALDASYEVSKVSNVISNLEGDCQFKQSWTIKALTDVTHIIHGVVCDEPGEIKLHNIYDKTNGTHLNTITSIGNEKRARYIIFLSKTLKPGETLSFDLEYTAEGYLSHLFKKGTEIMFQRSSTRRKVFYKSRTDIYKIPATVLTRKFMVKCDASSAQERFKISEIDDEITIEVDLKWDDPSDEGYSYEILARD